MLAKQARPSVCDDAELLGLSHKRVQELVAKEVGTVAHAGEPPIIVEDIARGLETFHPSGSDDELREVAAAIALAVALTWIQSRSSYEVNEGTLGFVAVILSNKSPPSTLATGSTATRETTPDTPAVIAASIFIASIVATV